MLSVLPLISVIIPVYNTAKYVRECLDSVIMQTLKDIEIICVNDGSTDLSLSILKEYEARDSRIKIHSQENKGLSAARNAGILISTGEYLYFLDSDDFIETEALEILYNEVSRDKLDILYFNSKTIFESEALKEKFSAYEVYYTRVSKNDAVCDGFTLFNTLQRDGIFRSMVQMQLINKDFLKSINLRFHEGILHEDELFTMLSILKARRVRYINLPLFVRRIREDSIMTQAKTFKHFYGIFTCYIQLTQFLSDSSYTKKEMKYIKRRINDSYLFNTLSIYRIYNGDEKGWQNSLSQYEQDILNKIRNKSRWYFLPKHLRNVYQNIKQVGIYSTAKMTYKVIYKKLVS